MALNFLSIGGTYYEVLTSGAEQQESERGGQGFRAFNGSLRSSYRWAKRTWQFDLYVTTTALEITLRTLVDLGAPITCTGTALNSASVSCEVLIKRSSYKKVSPTLQRRTVTVQLREA